MIGLLAKAFIKDYKNYCNPDVRTGYGILTGVTGIVLNFLLFAGKLAAGIFASSVSLVADAFNNLSDAGSSIVSIAGYRIAAMPADSEHPYGHGRAEYIAGFVVSSLIILTAFEIGKESVEKILSPSELSVSALSFVVLGVSIFVKLYMFIYNRKYGKLINSEPMKATSIDSLSDCIATLSAAAAFAVYALWNINIDGYIGLFIALVILKAGIDAAKSSVTPLLGQKADDELIAGIRSDVLAHSEVIGIHDLAVHNYGVNRYVISLHAELPSSLTFTEAHDLADIIENELHRKYSASVIIHTDPVDADNSEADKCRNIVLSVLKEIDSGADIHDLRLTERSGQMYLAFDAEVPFGLKISDEEIKKRLTDKISEYDSSLTTSIFIDKKVY
ncbi:MAG: cation transporter [Ruminiclostridium sp.]|nr:cation transporter [Ruminiclostridium sp.]